MASGESESTNIFNVANYNEQYWESYLEARPKYANGNFYDKIFAYHQAHSGCYNVAHDIGTGPGQVAAVLSDRFEHVVASDLNQTHLDVCQHRNSSNRNKISCVLCSGEQISSHISSRSVDTVFCAEALALMNTEQALDAFAKILKPDGTLAVWYYGRPIFSDRECQRIYDEMVNILFGHIIKGGESPIKSEQWKRTSDIMSSWFDNVRFPESQWKGVERHKWNTKNGKMTFHDEAACNFRYDYSSEIGKKEIVVEEMDTNLWAETWAINDVRRFVEVNLPSFAGRGLFNDPNVKQLFEDLEAAMGGKEARQLISWPVVLLLATRV